MKNVLLSLVLIAAMLVGTMPTVFGEQFSNPVAPPFSADPMIQKFGDAYYLAGTLAPNQTHPYTCFAIWKSYDMVNWYGPIRIVQCEDDVNFSNGLYASFAPEIYHYNGYYYVMATVNWEDAGSYIGLWRSESPEGPYEKYAQHPKKKLDPAIFVDTDGQSYMLNGLMYTTLSQDWSQQGTEWLTNSAIAGNSEGPYIIKSNNRYMMFTATYEAAYYYDQIASYTDSLENGTWSLYNDGRPVYDGTGIGHGGITVSPDGTELWVHGHTNTDLNGGGWSGRALSLDKITLNDDGFPNPAVQSLQPQDVPSRSVINANLAQGKPTNASEFFSEDTRPAKATDGNSDTCWEAFSAKKSKQLDVDLMGEFNVKEFKIDFQEANAYQYKILGSYDRVNWDVLVDKSSNTESVQTCVDTVSTDKYYRHFRLEITNQYSVGVKEFQVINNKTVTSDQIPALNDVVPLSDVMAQVWSYTTSNPGTGWTNADFNDSAWTKGNGGFGKKYGVIGTDWETGDIWLRKTFTLTDYTPEQIDNFDLRIFHDDDAQVYINGVLAYSGTGSCGGYASFDISDEAKAAIKTNGENVIAVHATGTGNEQFIDVGIRETAYKYYTAEYNFALDKDGNAVNSDTIVDALYNSITHLADSVTVVGTPKYVSSAYSYAPADADYKALATKGGQVKLTMPAGEQGKGIWDNSNFSFWISVKPNTDANGTSWETIVNRDGLFGGFQIDRAPDGRLAFHLGNNGVFHDLFVDGSNLAKDNWYDICFTYYTDNSSGTRVDTFKAYLNGKLVLTKTANTAADYTTVTNIGPYVLGSDINGGQLFSGQYDKIMFFNRILSAEEIELYSPLKLTAPTMDLKFSVDGSGNPVNGGAPFSTSVYNAASGKAMTAQGDQGTPKYVEYTDGVYAGAGVSTADGKIIVKNDSSVDAWTGENFSFWLRVKPDDSHTDWRTLVRRGDISGFQVDCAWNNQFALHIGEHFGDKFSGVVLENGKWYDLGFSYSVDNTGITPVYTAKMYVNGALTATHTITDQTSNNVKLDGDFYIGYNSVGQQYDATFDRLRYYNTVLTDEEFEALSAYPLDNETGSNSLKFTSLTTSAGEGDTVVVNASVRNYTYSRQTANVIFALYDEETGVLKDVELAPVTIDVNQTADLTRTLSSSGTASSIVKAFIWLSYDNPLPFSTVKVLD